MKILFTLLGILGCTIFFSFCRSSNDEQIKTFIIEMTDARMMDREEGRLAAAKGSNQAIKSYGSLMVKDQTFLLEELRKLAASENVQLPVAISEKKRKALKKLEMKQGEDFDKKFLSMIKIDHKRDVRKFKGATQFNDVEARKFAQKYLPLIESHLEGVKQIKKNT